MVSCYIPLKQHLSISIYASLHNNFPCFCCCQQHVFTSLAVSVQVIFDEAADAIVATVNAASNGSHFVITFINSPTVRCFLSLHLGAVFKVNYLFSKP